MSGISNVASSNPLISTTSLSKKTASAGKGSMASGTYTPSPATKALQDLVLSRFMDVTQSMNETLSTLNPSLLSASATNPLFGLGDSGGTGLQGGHQDAALGLLDFNKIALSSSPSLASSINYLLTITNNNSSAVQSYLKMMILPTDLFGDSSAQQSPANDISSLLQSPGSIIDQLL